MGFDSWLEADVLHFGARPHAHPREVRYVLHPVWVYRVYARPRISEPLNPIQRATLGLCAAGVRRVDEIGAHLGLHPQLAGFVALQLDDRGLLDRRTMEPSARGQEALAGALTASETALVADLFQDACTGELLVCTLERPGSCEVVGGSGRTFRLMLGTHGDPRRARALALLPGDGAAPEPPEAGAVLPLLRAACTRCGGEEGVGGPHPAERSDFAHLTLVDAPRRGLLTTLVYRPSRASEGAGWFVADPFGGGMDPHLRKFVGARLGEDGVLAEWLAPVLDGAGPDDAGGPAGLVEARARVEARLGPPVAGREELFEVFAEFEAACAREAREDARALAAGVARLRDHAGRVLTEVLAALCDSWPTRGLAETLAERDREHRDALLAQAARNAGAARLPDPLLHVAPAELRGACDLQEGSVPAFLLAGVLAAERQPSHPLRRSLARDPLLLDILMSVCRHLDAAPSGPRKLRLEIDRIHDTLFAGVAPLLDGLTGPGLPFS
jgi:hypothetical protein